MPRQMRARGSLQIPLLTGFPMKITAFAVLSLIAMFCNAQEPDAAIDADTAKAPGSEVEVNMATAPTSEASDFCFFSGDPPADVKYTVIRAIRVGKGTYGGVKEILPKFAGYAQKIGADAIIEYTGSQRFGFWPWRMVHPVVRGVAIKWADTPHPNCSAIGGTTLSAILASDRAPAQ